MDIAEYEKSCSLEDTCWWWVGRRDLIPVLLGHPSGCEELVLDVGTGTGGSIAVLEGYGLVTGLDSSSEALAYARARGQGQLVLASAEELCFKADVFDLVTALDVLEHVDDVRTLRSMHVVLKPGGTLLVTVPAFDCLWSGHDLALGHRRRYRKVQLRRILETSGFRVVKLSYWNTTLFLPIMLKRTVDREILGNKMQTDVHPLPGFANSILASVLRHEPRVLRYLDLPVGVSLVYVAEPCR